MLFTEHQSIIEPVVNGNSEPGSDFFCRLFPSFHPCDPASGLVEDITGRFHYSSSQAYVSPDRYRVVLLDGSVDNALQLIERYASERDRDRLTQPALIAHLYDEMGEDFLQRLRGPFSFVIWDSEAGRLFAGRSVVGQCSVFYTKQEGALELSSSLRRLCSMFEHPPEIDETSIRGYLRWAGIRAPRTPFKGIHALGASEWMSWRGEETSSGRHWNLPPMSRWDLNIARTEALVDEKISDAMSLSLGSMGHPGCLLSGSLNSSTLVAYGQKARRPGQGFTTYSLSSYFNSRRESRLSKQVAELLSAEFVEVWQRDDAMSTAQEIASMLDCPSGHRGLIRFFLLMSARENSSDGVLAGFGGDELFAGRPYHLMTNIPGLFRLMPGIIRRRLLGERLGSWKNLADPCEGFKYWTESFSQEQVELLLGSSEESDSQEIDCYQGEDALRSFVAMDLCYRLPDLLVSPLERIARGSGRTLRLPFLSGDLVELICLIPHQFILNGLASKFILRRLLQKRMPPHVLHEHPDGRERVFKRWLKQDLREMLFDTLAASGSLSTSHLNRSEVAKMLSKHFTGEEDCGAQLWSLLILELWWKSMR